MLTPTQDPHVWIEEQRKGYVRYRNSEGRRWEVHGECVGLGHCIVGAVVDGREVETVVEARALWEKFRELGVPDCPVTPEFKGCCSFTFVELERA